MPNVAMRLICWKKFFDQPGVKEKNETPEGMSRFSYYLLFSLRASKMSFSSSSANSGLSLMAALAASRP